VHAAVEGTEERCFVCSEKEKEEEDLVACWKGC